MPKLQKTSSNQDLTSLPGSSKNLAPTKSQKSKSTARSSNTKEKKGKFLSKLQPKSKENSNTKLIMNILSMNKKLVTQKKSSIKKFKPQLKSFQAIKSTQGMLILSSKTEKPGIL